MKRSVALIFFLFFAGALLFAQSDSARSANRRTAIRYLQLAKQYASQKQWKEADSNARLGLAYDDGIADLWYIRAVSQSNTGEKKSVILPLVVRSLTKGEWVDYNRDSARILYADVLSTTLCFKEAVEVLDQAPFLYSADAEYIRSRCYYNMGGEYIERAREKIDAARRIYPTDLRFAELFFSQEYRLHKTLLQDAASGLDTEGLPYTVRKIADAFILAMSSYTRPSAELELYAAIFAEGEKQNRLLQSFKARNLTTPLYAEYALRTGLLEEEAALDVFFFYADDTISLTVIQDFVPLIREEKAKQDLYEYLNAYGGRVIADSDSDGLANVITDYNRGRPLHVFYGREQDDEFDWIADCDFGVPVKVHLTDSHLDVLYGSWPWIKTARYTLQDNSELDFNLVGEMLRWTPFVMRPVEAIKSALNLEFFFPDVQAEVVPVSAVELLHASSSYTLPSDERKGAMITVSLLDGVAQIARYTVGDEMYAQAQFEKGIPVIRVVDRDGDGLFETTEFYGFSPDRKQTVISQSDEMQIITNLFGSPSSGTGFYVRMIQVDTNGDTIPDFTEEYLPGEGKISSWDTTSDGKWNTRYIKYPKSEDGVLREDSLFHQPLTNAEVCVSFENGTPVQVRDGNRILPVLATGIPDFFWIGQRGSDKNMRKIIDGLNQRVPQGVCIIVENEKERMLGVRIGKMTFGEMLPESTVKDDEKN
ncbi:MAG: hypothetical protein IKS40_01980 [Treponema sp.]|nr:hypothetical protein [Treponema sp.]